MPDETTDTAEREPRVAGGRPSLFRPEYAEQAFKLCLLGATDVEIADFFEVCEATVNNWKLAYPEFKAQLRAGKKQADIHIASKLYDRAEGARWTEEAAFKVKREFFDGTGKKTHTEEEIVTVPLVKGAPPDTTAIIFWLKNRDRANWRDKQELQHTGKDGEALPDRALEELPGEVLIELIALNGKLASGAEDGADQPAGNPA